MHVVQPGVCVSQRTDVHTLLHTLALQRIVGASTHAINRTIREATLI